MYFAFFPVLYLSDFQDVNIFQAKYTPFEEFWARLQEQYRKKKKSKAYTDMLWIYINTWSFIVIKFTW